MKRNTVIHLELPSEKLLKVLLKALLPETKKPTTSRSKVSVEGEGKKLTIRIEAKDTSALRATLNSYLRWVALVKDTYEVAVSLEKTSHL
ncbi:MAG: KEOPS complex subunit Pcc1 [Candidatus Bathyarchaeota archaeon]|nr:KEOPS complex subunit Pcc1 [Candidatus Bathyarchaeota archaeon]MDH5495485.1 KEOPS complex subunit Pcc1 [Candidatus Bathyarchaeota archaeon]